MRLTPRRRLARGAALRWRRGRRATRRELERQQLGLRQPAAAEVARRPCWAARRREQRRRRRRRRRRPRAMTAQQIIARGSAVRDESLASRRAGADRRAAPRRRHACEHGYPARAAAATRRQASRAWCAGSAGEQIAHGFLADAALGMLSPSSSAFCSSESAGCPRRRRRRRRRRHFPRLSAAPVADELHTALGLCELVSPFTYYSTSPP